MSKVTSRGCRDARWTFRIMVGIGCCFCLPSALAQHGTRSLSGTVMDAQHEPLKGAVVQVHDEETDAIMSYITDRTGNYSFKRLNADVDYDIWATFRTRRSRKREISRFDAHPEKVLNLVIRSR